jgi:hypothetical protein
MYIEPLFPELVVPVLKTSMPLLPAEPAFDEVIDTRPLEEPVPSPLWRLNGPPMVPEDAPPTM